MSRAELLPYGIIFLTLIICFLVVAIVFSIKKISSINDEISVEKVLNPIGFKIFFGIFEILAFFMLIPVLSVLRGCVVDGIDYRKDFLYLLFVVLFILGKILIELLIVKRGLKFSRKKSIKLVVICNLILDSIDFWFVFCVLDPIYL